jgi:hypothetical protein
MRKKKKLESGESPQLDLSEQETSRLGTRVLQDYRNGLADHNRRMARWAEYMERWEGTPDVPEEGQERDSNMPVPYIRWNVLAQWAKEMDSLFGEDAQIVAEPVGASNYKRAKKVGLYMTWRVFNSMKLVSPFCEFVLRKIIFGRSFAYSPWVRKTYQVRGKEVVDYEGPGFEPLWPDDFIVPAEEHKTLHEFSWVVRKYRVTPDDLLEGEKAGRYSDAVSANFEQIVNLSRQAPQREAEGDEVKLAEDEAKGVAMTMPQSAGDTLVVLEWYGKWRMLLNPDEDGDEYDLTKRERMRSDIMVRFLPDVGNLVIGVQDLEELYPDLARRRPFVESSLLKDGSYWSPGLGKMLIDLEDDIRQNHNQGTTAGENCTGPVIFYRPATSSVLDREAVEIKPKTLIPVDNPSTDVRVETLPTSTQFMEMREQTLIGYGERLTGLTDPAMGRSSDRPNAPRTLGGQTQQLQEGSVRIALNTLVLREDMALVLQHFWLLEYMFSPKQTFFRVTEDDADGLFPVNDGGSMLEREDRDGRYDFKLEFATSLYSREMDKQRTLQRYELDLQNPLIAQNPRALWAVTRDVHEALGDPNFDELVPEPPEGDLPVNPKEEFSRLLHGEEIHVNPMDNDELHMLRHRKDMADLEADAEKTKEPLPDTHSKLVMHYIQHIDQMQHKKVVQALAEAAVQKLGSGLPPQIAQRLSGGAAIAQQATNTQPGVQPGPAQPGTAL